MIERQIWRPPGRRLCSDANCLQCFVLWSGDTLHRGSREVPAEAGHYLGPSLNQLLMRRDLQRLAAREFDLLVVGAGIYGATIACEAAQRGLTVALIDRGDFGAATSANSLKTVHGGLRSLQRANVTEMRRFVRERRTLLRIAPHLAHPLRFVIPTRRTLTRSRAAMSVALTLNDWLARDRNDGVDPARRLPPSMVIGRDELLQLIPGLDPRVVTGGASWYDAQLSNPDRFLLAFVEAAAASGACVANYVAATAFLQRAGGVRGISARDELTGETFDIQAHVTLNVAGGWALPLLRSVDPGLPARVGVRISRAFNLVTRLPAPPCAVGNTAGGQYLFCVPWRNIAIFGTMHDNGIEDAERLSVGRTDVERFVGLINKAFPSVSLTLDDVTLVHRGLLPAVGQPDGDVQLAKESPIRDHRADGVPGLMTVVGVRYTTARETAQQAIDMLATVLDRRVAASRSADVPLPGGDVGDVTEFEQTARRAAGSVGPAGSGSLRPGAIDRLLRSYGSRYGDVMAVMQTTPTLAAPVSATCDISGAEVLRAIRDEMAVKVQDVVFRRTEAGSAGHPGTEAVAAIAAIMATELQWDRARVDAEIRSVDERYRIPV